MSKLHFYYIIGILVALLMGSLTVHWYDIKDLAQLLSFGLALSSLTLAVLAIIQVIVLGSSLAGIVGSIRGSVDQVQSAAAQIGRASDQLLAHAEGIPPALDAMSARLEETQKEMQGYFASGAQSFSGSSQNTAQGTPEVWQRTTRGGSLAYYLCGRAFEQRKPFVTAHPGGPQIW
jgi:methyl-accepting chemotaxis protein